MLVLVAHEEGLDHNGPREAERHQQLERRDLGLVFFQLEIHQCKHSHLLGYKQASEMSFALTNQEAAI